MRGNPWSTGTVTEREGAQPSVGPMGTQPGSTSWMVELERKQAAWRAEIEASTSKRIEALKSDLISVVTQEVQGLREELAELREMLVSAGLPRSRPSTEDSAAGVFPGKHGKNGFLGSPSSPAVWSSGNISSPLGAAPSAAGGDYSSLRGGLGQHVDPQFFERFASQNKARSPVELREARQKAVCGKDPPPLAAGWGQAFGLRCALLLRTTPLLSPFAETCVHDSLCQVLAMGRDVVWVRSADTIGEKTTSSTAQEEGCSAGVDDVALFHLFFEVRCESRESADKATAALRKLSDPQSKVFFSELKRQLHEEGLPVPRMLGVYIEAMDVTGRYTVGVRRPWDGALPGQADEGAGTAKASPVATSSLSRPGENHNQTAASRPASSFPVPGGSTAPVEESSVPALGPWSPPTRPGDAAPPLAVSSSTETRSAVGSSDREEDLRERERYGLASTPAEASSPSEGGSQPKSLTMPATQGADVTEPCKGEEERLGGEAAAATSSIGEREGAQLCYMSVPLHHCNGYLWRPAYGTDS